MGIRFFLFVLLLAAGAAGFVAVQAKARLLWRLLSTGGALVLCCWSCSRFTKATTYHEVQSHYTRGLREFVGDLEKMAVAGRTNEVAHASERFQKEFNIWYKGDAVSNFWDLVAETSNAANRTNKP